jgi:hypothetical protein
LAGSGLSVTPANPNRALAASPATVADLPERRFFRCMLIFLREPLEQWQRDGSTTGVATFEVDQTSCGLCDAHHLHHRFASKARRSTKISVIVHMAHRQMSQPQ